MHRHGVRGVRLSTPISSLRCSFSSAPEPSGQLTPAPKPRAARKVRLSAGEADEYRKVVVEMLQSKTSSKATSRDVALARLSGATKLHMVHPLIKSRPMVQAPSQEKEAFFAAPEEDVEDVDDAPGASSQKVIPGSFVEIRRCDSYRKPSYDS